MRRLGVHAHRPFRSFTNASYSRLIGNSGLMLMVFPFSVQSVEQTMNLNRLQYTLFSEAGYGWKAGVSGHFMT